MVGKVVRALLVAPKVEQDGRSGGRQANFLPGRLAVAAHDEHLLARQPGKHRAHAGLHLPGNGLLQGFVAFFGVVGFEEKLSRSNLAGPEFFHNGFLLQLVAEGHYFKISRVEAGGKLVHVLARNRLVLQG